MHAHAALLERLYSSLNRHDAAAMADCYQKDAVFHDIAFHLEGHDRIAWMWRMICTTDIRTTFEIVRADDSEGVVKLVDEYTFSETGRRVKNPIESRFELRDGRIARHRDLCDARVWADEALGGVTGFLAGRLRFLRAWKAGRMLEAFVRDHKP